MQQHGHKNLKETKRVHTTWFHWCQVLEQTKLHLDASNQQVVVLQRQCLKKGMSNFLVWWKRLNVDLGGDYIGIYICQNSCNSTLNSCAFTIFDIHIDYISIKSD